MNAKLQLGAVWRVPTDALDMKKVAEELTIHNLSTQRNREIGIPTNQKTIEYVELWDHNEDGTTSLPRGLKVSRFCLPGAQFPVSPMHPQVRALKDADRDHGRIGRLGKGLFVRKFWEEQWDVLTEISGQSHNGRLDHLIQLGCGRGKTTIAIGYASMHGAKTLILVDQEFIADQWDEEIESCTRTPVTSVGRIQQKKTKVGARWTVATLHTLARRFEDGSLPPDWADQFDLVIFDECVARGTKIRMGDGAQKNVEDVVVGDFVATPLGPRRVYATKMSRQRACARATVGGNSVLLTKEHPIAKAEMHDDGSMRCLWEEALPAASGGGGGVPLQMPRVGFLYAGGGVQEVRRDGCLQPEGATQNEVLRVGPGADEGDVLATPSGRGGDPSARIIEPVQGYEGRTPSVEPRTDAYGQPDEPTRSAGEGLQAMGEHQPSSLRKGLREGDGGDGERGPCVGSSGAFGLREGEVRGRERGGACETGDSLQELHGGLSAPNPSFGDRDRRVQPQGERHARRDERRILRDERLPGSEVAGDVRALRAASAGACQPAPLSVEETDTVSDVFDLSVEEAACFFANDVLVHNCHVAACASFLGVLPRFACRRIGLSATPERADGMQKAFLFHLGGEEATFTNTARRKSAKWIFTETPEIIRPGTRSVPDFRADKKHGSVASLFRSIPGTNHFRVEHSVHKAFVSKDRAWNDQIVKDVKRAVATGRYVIVLGPTVEHLEHLSALMEAEGLDVGCVTGKVKKGARSEVFNNRQVVLATDKLAYKALNIPQMNTLFLLYPNDDENFMMQASGRIDRGSTGPVIYTYVHSYIRNLAKKASRMQDVCRKLDPGGEFKGWVTP